MKIYSNNTYSCNPLEWWIPSETKKSNKLYLEGKLTFDSGIYIVYHRNNIVLVVLSNLVRRQRVNIVYCHFIKDLDCLIIITISVITELHCT